MIDARLDFNADPWIAAPAEWPHWQVCGKRGWQRDIRRPRCTTEALRVLTREFLHYPDNACREGLASTDSARSGRRSGSPTPAADTREGRKTWESSPAASCDTRRKGRFYRRWKIEYAIRDELWQPRPFDLNGLWPPFGSPRLNGRLDIVEGASGVNVRVESQYCLDVRGEAGKREVRGSDCSTTTSTRQFKIKRLSVHQSPGSPDQDNTRCTRIRLDYVDQVLDVGCSQGTFIRANHNAKFPATCQETLHVGLERRQPVRGEVARLTGEVDG
jgi:hypothetical protein